VGNTLNMEIEPDIDNHKAIYGTHFVFSYSKGKHIDLPLKRYVTSIGLLM
jgi:hypothetical protein